MLHDAGGPVGGNVPADIRNPACGLAGVRVVPLPPGGGQQVGACGQGAAGGVVQHTQVSSHLYVGGGKIQREHNTPPLKKNICRGWNVDARC